MAERKLEQEVEQILKTIEQKKNFVLSGGAGSGKTYSLVSTINAIYSINPLANIACITYTNTVVDEIKNRVDTKSLNVDTIHSFLWNIISPYQKELKETLAEGIELNEYINIKEKNKLLFQQEYYKIHKIEYKDYLDIKKGIISHDEVITLAECMFYKYKKLNLILNNSFDYIFVDEYQDTFKDVINIFLEYSSGLEHKSIYGFFGDSMQSIYDTGIGDLNDYIGKNIIEIRKEQNRRNPEMVINLANKLRNDGLQQQASEDLNAPNMENGTLKKGSIKFLYSFGDIDLDKIKKQPEFNNWDFKSKDKTKQLMLTHKLIARENSFINLFNLFNDKFIDSFKKLLENSNIDKDQNKTIKEVVEQYNLYDKVYKIINKNKDLYSMLYDLIKDKPIAFIYKTYISKDGLITQNINERHPLIIYLFKIQSLVKAYQNKNYNYIITEVDMELKNLSTKTFFKEKIEYITNNYDKSIGDILDYVHDNGLFKKDDKITNNQYIYESIRKISYMEVVKLYEYIEEFTPYSTQHKIKGEEYDNVFVVLDNGKWSKYQFKKLFIEDIANSKQNDIFKRTLNLFYVCCTRAKENLVVYLKLDPNTKSDNQKIINRIEYFFGKENCRQID